MYYNFGKRKTLRVFLVSGNSTILLHAQQNCYPGGMKEETKYWCQTCLISSYLIAQLPRLRLRPDQILKKLSQANQVQFWTNWGKIIYRDKKIKIYLAFFKDIVPNRPKVGPNIQILSFSATDIIFTKTKIFESYC